MADAADCAALPLAAPAARPAAPLRVACLTLEAATPAWRAMIRDGIATPYQNPAFLRAHAEALSEAEGFTARALVVSDGAGRPVALLPLAVQRRGPVRLARPLGGKHANFHWPVLARPDLEPDALRAALRDAAGALGVDAYAFTNMPLSWRGVPNPLAGPGARPSPSAGWRLTLSPDPDETMARTYSRDTRKKLRYQEKQLGVLGPVAYRQATTPAEVDAWLDRFFALKADRFAAQGLPDPFAPPAVRAFLKSACRDGLPGGTPAVELHALLVGERIAALLAGVVDGHRMSGMLVAFDPEPAIARCGPGNVLAIRVVRACCERGLEAFDLGVGEARYKETLCPEPEPLVDWTFPVNARGRAFAALAGLAGRGKRTVKQTPWLWALAQRARRLRG